MTAPTREHLNRRLGYANENLRLADAATDDAERHGRLKQAALAFSEARRITDVLAGAIAPAEPAQGPVLSYGAPGHPAVFAPGPR